ncbi:MAG: hypothetical protein NT062_02600, partial [Proteobacteria bacterium]|nr:hypothetical protein [Pseudomonadota bacterium]
GDAFGNDSSVWDRFQAAEDRIDSEVVESEVDAAMRGEEVDAQAFDRKLAAAQSTNAGLLASGAGGVADPSDPLAALKAKMTAAKEAKEATKQNQLGDAASPDGKGPK